MDSKQKAKELIETFTFNCRECDNAKLSALFATREHLIARKEYWKEIEQQIAIIKAIGEKTVKYLEKYKGQSIYNEIALAIEFGYQLKVEENEQT